mgnify:CR=1 FL=1
MEIVEIIAEVLKYAVPALLVLVGMKYMVDAQQRQREAQQEAEMRKVLFREHFNLVLSAHERAILFLERVSPEQLFSRHMGKGKSKDEFRLELVAQIRSEYEHNLVQQLYISPEGWALLQQARDEMIGLIHQTAQQVEADDGQQIARAILEKVGGRQDLTYQKAIFVIKRDLRKYFEPANKKEA